jgi:hypothetical protein
VRDEVGWEVSMLILRVFVSEKDKGRVEPTTED